MQTIQTGQVSTAIAFEDGKTVIGRFQDCTPILDRAKALHNEGQHGGSELKHAAKLPMVLVERYCNDNGITFQQFMNGEEHIRRMCNDPSLSGFRIWKGLV